MKASNRDVEQAEQRVEEEKAAMINRAKQTLEPNAASDCMDCGEAISAARKKALPSAKRCIDCQTREERR